MRVAIYVRVSTTEQTVAPQLDGLQQYAEARGFTVVHEYTDEGVSGARASRPGLDGMLEDAHRRRFDGILVWRLDRIARSVKNLVELVARLDHLGVHLIALDQQFDTSSPAGRFVMHTLAACAELERDLARERTKAALAAARRRGKRLGRPRKFMPVGEARALISQGHSVSSAARELGVCRETLRRALHKYPARTASPTSASASV